MRNRPVRVASLFLVTLVTVAAPAYAATITGTPEDDVLTGTADADRIDARAGNDVLSGLGGPDLLFGEGGNDGLDGGDGHDRLGGGIGADQLKGGYGQDRLNVSDGDRAYGGPQNDDVVARNGTFVVHGGPGADRVDASGGGEHTLFGDGGDDRLEVEHQQNSNTRLIGGPGNDEVYAFDGVADGAARVATLEGGTGDDSVAGEASLLIGGAGNDTLSTYANPNGSPRTVSCGDGVDFVSSFARDDIFHEDCETVELYLNVYSGGTLEGTRYNDIVYGDLGDETITTLAGDDQVDARLGSDEVDLGPGDDHFQNWGGHDEDDVDVVTCGAGNDQVAVHRADIVARDCESVDYRD
jgi:Ca2+-binding RTX toxin-like protein